MGGQQSASLLSGKGEPLPRSTPWFVLQKTAFSFIEPSLIAASQTPMEWAAMRVHTDVDHPHENLYQQHLDRDEAQEDGPVSGPSAAKPILCQCFCVRPLQASHENQRKVQGFYSHAHIYTRTGAG